LAAIVGRESGDFAVVGTAVDREVEFKSIIEFLSSVHRHLYGREHILEFERAFVPWSDGEVPLRAGHVILGI
jgi:hypothetical protein